MKMITLNQSFNKLRKRKFFVYGVPFLLFVVGGSFGLKEFTTLKFDARKGNLIKPEEVEKYGVTMKKPAEVTLDTEYDKIKNMNIEDWENKRGPRPWEE